VVLAYDRPGLNQGNAAMFSTIDAEKVYRQFVIETDGTGEHWVADKSGPSVLTSERFKSAAEAQREWSRRVEAALA
jgi:hypothetical protein